MSEPIPQDWKTDNLFVLIGGNPLPNYVAAQLLLKSEGQLHLVCSTATEGLADKLIEYFPNCSIKHTLQDPADRNEVRCVMNDALRKQCKSGTVGLHYTGGTKSMAVHVYQFLQDKRNDTIFTYLDSRSKTLRRDGQEPTPKVQFGVTPTISELFDLHDITLQKELPGEIPQPLFPQLEEALAKAHSTGEGVAAYDQWCCRYLRKQMKKNAAWNQQTLEKLLTLAKNHTEDNFYRQATIDLRASKLCKSEKIEKVAQLSLNPIPFPDHPKLSAVTEAMQLVFDVNDAAFEPQAVVTHLKLQWKIQKFEHLVDYLDGAWLEYWALAAFLTNQHKHKLHSMAISMKTEARLNFEFDVAAMQGYQLYAITCTRSDDKDLCKSKLFEAFTRATQIGGDEALVGLVCACSDPEALQRQVAETWRMDGNRMRVFGITDLPKLSEKFDEWLRL